MNPLFFLSIIVLLSVFVSAKKATELTPDTFYDFIKNSPNGASISFTAPWCPHCKRLKPVWDTLASNGDANFANVNCENYKTFCKGFNIRGFPTIKFFKDDKMYDQKDRSEKGATKFVKGGYKQLSGQKIPTVKPSDIPNVFTADGFASIFTSSATQPILFIGMAIGFLLGSIFFILLCGIPDAAPAKHVVQTVPSSSEKPKTE